jgi:hypothetical protein
VCARRRVRGCRWEEVLAADRGYEGDYLDAVREREVFLGDGACCDAACEG